MAQTEKKEDNKTDQEIKEYESQFQIVKFSYANAHCESQSKMASRDFYFADQMITIKQSGQKDEIPTRVWDASIVLSHYLNQNAKHLELSSKCILEIGAGLGLCSIVCSLLNSKHVYLTDIDQNCMLLAKENIELNKCKDNISIHEYYWGSDINQTTMKQNKFDIVIGADCIYLKDTYKSLITTFVDIFKYNPNSIIILAFAERFYHQNIFYNLLKKNKSFVVKYIENIDIDLAKTNKVMTITYQETK